MEEGPRLLLVEGDVRNDSRMHYSYVVVGKF